MPICEAWCCYIYLHVGDFVRANVGKYSSTMEHIGMANCGEWWNIMVFHVGKDGYGFSMVWMRYTAVYLVGYSPSHIQIHPTYPVEITRVIPYFVSGMSHHIPMEKCMKMVVWVGTCYLAMENDGFSWENGDYQWNMWKHCGFSGRNPWQLWKEMRCINEKFGDMRKGGSYSEMS